MQLITILLTLTLHFEAPFEPWGADTDLRSKQVETTENKTHIGQKTCRAMIRFFQVCISPIDGPRSSFYPTSSQYALDAIEKHGVLKGIALGCDRLLRENKDQWVYPRTRDYGIERKYDPVR